MVKRYLKNGDKVSDRVSVTYTRLEKEGVVAARNKGIVQTHAPFVAFLDSDDYWHPDKLEKQLEAITRDDNIAVAHTSYRYVDEQGRYCDEGSQRLDNPCVGWCVSELLNEDLVIFSSVLMRRSVIDEAAEAEPHGLPFDPRWTNAQDYDLLLRAAKIGEYAYTPEPLTLYRLHSGHGAMGNLPRAFGFHCRVQIDFVKRHGQDLGLTSEGARRRAANFIYGRANSAFWQRQLATANQLCQLARELEISDNRFDELERKTSKPGWIYTVKDVFDRLMGRG